MAQSTAGIKLFYGTSADGIAEPTAYTEIPNVVSVPALTGDPNMLDATTLAETTMKRYIMGLSDAKGLFTYSVQLTPATKTATDAAAGIAAGKAVFAVAFPAPYSEYYYYFGTARKVVPGEQKVDDVLVGNFYTSQESEVKEKSGLPAVGGA